MIRLGGFLRRNLLAILLGCLILAQILTWRAMVAIQEDVAHYGCGTVSHPCRVVIIPEK